MQRTHGYTSHFEYLENEVNSFCKSHCVDLEKSSGKHGFLQIYNAVRPHLSAIHKHYDITIAPQTPNKLCLKNALFVWIKNFTKR